MLRQLYCRIISDIVIGVGNKNEKKINDIVDVGENHNRNENIKVSPKYMDLSIIFFVPQKIVEIFFSCATFEKINKRLTDRVSISLFMVLLEYRTRRVGSVSDWDVYFINHTPGAIKHQAVVRRQLPCKTLKYSKNDPANIELWEN
ncbi:unnamed protein product [Rhizophagus irregularis]|uniref:Uncharacterized protein n=1 Tax=Rhizophagus irregularis TaxID=588596 RepID=A0A915Z759_9GLOM|nr:unnamed protein product [Rhizophagus irregularis]CAB5365398.1 unnamed protein product [Rhizophagus irregularis]